MSWVYWIAAVPQIAIYTAVGMLKLVKSPPKLVADHGFDWVDSVAPWAVKGIGALELAAVAALIAPMLLGWGPLLPVAASGGLIVLQVGAAITNVRFSDTKKLPLNLILVLLAAGTAVAAFLIG